MKFVKLTAKPDTWFKAGTEVYDYDADYSEKKLITLDYWNKSVEGGWGIDVRGIRVCQEDYELKFCNCEVGFEREDGELCSCDEFEVEIIEL